MEDGKGIDIEQQKPASELPPAAVSLPQENGSESGRRRRVFKEEIIQEAKKQLWLAGPLVVTNFLLTAIQVISVMFVGHVGELALSGASVANSFALVTGFSLMIGMSCALDTFCGQSYGAEQYRMLGIHTQRATVILLIVALPIAGIWGAAGQILRLLRQDPEISAEAGVYARYMIPSLFAYAILMCQYKFLQTQNIIMPMLLSTGITTLIHVPICWSLVFKTSLGMKGAPLATDISYFINVIMLALYIRMAPSCKDTWTGFSRESFRKVLFFIKLAIPSALMICAEIWAFEVIVLLSGLLPDPKLETSAMSISLNASTIFFMIPVGLGEVISVRVSNELGAGNPKAANLAVRVATSMVVAESIVQSVIVIFGRRVWGHLYSKDERVVEYVAKLLILVAVMQFLNGFQAALGGIARGCGWQKIGAIVNLATFYLLGVPLGALLAFVFHLHGKGLWTGLIVAVFVQVVILMIITVRTNWDKEAQKATARVGDSMIREVSMQEPVSDRENKQLHKTDDAGTERQHPDGENNAV